MRALLAVTVLAAACGSKPPRAIAPSNGSAKAAPGEVRQTPVNSPYDVKTWTDKLRDPRESERAVAELEQLGDPAAIKPLGELWQADGRPVRVLQVMIGLAAPLTADEAKAKFFTEYEKTGRAASWDVVLPYLKQAVTEVDDANPRSVEGAIKAADALGEAKQGLDALIELAQRPPTKKLIAAEISAIRAIGGFDGEKAKAAAALVKNLERDPPAHPRTAADVAARRSLEEAFGLYLASTGASVNALAELKTPSAAKSLVIVMYRSPELFTQVRRALVASGPAAKAELRKAMRGDSAEVEKLFKARKLDLYCGELDDQKCEPVSAKTFYPAVVLGDFYDPAVVPDLLAVLRSAPAPVYYADDQPSPTTQYNAVFDALRKIGSPGAVAPVRALWLGASSKVDVQTQALAIATYPFVSRDQIGVAELAKIAVDNKADDTLRQEAATALARLTTNVKDITVLRDLANKYVDASAKKAKEAASKQKEADAADKEYEVVKQATEAAKQKAMELAHDESKSAAEIKAVVEDAKKANDALKVARKKYKDRIAPFKQLDSAAKAYLGFARMFQTHIARIEIADRCKVDLACFAAILTAKPEYVVSLNEKYIPELASWTADEKRELLIAEIDRALLEIGKRGVAASGLTDALLAAAGSDVRLVRGGVLLALPKIAKLPCASCVVQLDAAIRAGEGKTTLGDLNLETTVLRNYFVWAGGREPN